MTQTIEQEQLIRDLHQHFGEPIRDDFSLEDVWLSDNGKYRLVATYNAVALYTNSEEFNEDNEDAEDVQFITSLGSLPYDFRVTTKPGTGNSESVTPEVAKGNHLKPTATRRKI